MPINEPLFLDEGSSEEISLQPLSAPKVPEIEAKIADKTNKVQQAVKAKAENLRWKKGMLTGYEDADTPIVEGQGSVRESAEGTSFSYDAVEGAHYEDGILKYTDPKGYADSNRWKKDPQALQVSKITGKPIEELTNQDYIDVANMQQIQRLSDQVNEPGSSWSAPFIKGVDPVNLTGVYRDENNKREEIPLNIPIAYKGLGKAQVKKGSGQKPRNLGEIGQFIGDDQVFSNTKRAMIDPMQNSLYGKARRQLGVKPLTTYQSEEEPEYSVKNTLRGVGSGAVSLAGQVGDAAATGVSNLARFAVESIDREDLYTEDNDKFVKDFFNEMKTSEYAQELTGYDPSYSEGKIKKSLSDFKKGNYFTGFVNMIQASPDTLGSSAAYMALLSNPLGLGLGIMGEYNDSIESFKENNGRDPKNAELARMMVADVIKVSLEKLPFEKAIVGKSAMIEGVNKLLQSVPEGMKRNIGKYVAERIGVLAANMAEEGSQEAAQYVIDYFNREYGTAKD